MFPLPAPSGLGTPLSPAFETFSHVVRESIFGSAARFFNSSRGSSLDTVFLNYASRLLGLRFG